MTMRTQLNRIETLLLRLDVYCRTELALRPGAPSTPAEFYIIKGSVAVAERLDNEEMEKKKIMTNKTVEDVALAICKDLWAKGLIDMESPPEAFLIPAKITATVAIAAYLKALEEEGKRIISEHDIQELITNRRVYEG